MASVPTSSAVARAESGHERNKGASMLALLGNPAKYDGQRVCTTGYLGQEKPDRWNLYVSAEDARVPIRVNSISVEANESVRNFGDGSLVELCGRFAAREAATLADSSGLLRQLTHAKPALGAGQAKGAGPSADPTADAGPSPEPAQRNSNQ